MKTGGEDNREQADKAVTDQPAQEREKSVAEEPDASEKATAADEDLEMIETPAKPTAPSQPSTAKEAAPAAPSVRRFAREIGIDVHTVKGSGPGGRISLDDVKQHAKLLNEQRAASPAGMPGATRKPLPDFSKWGKIEITPMTQIRKKTAEHLADAWSTVAQVTHFDKADITNIEQLRDEYKSKVKEAGGVLTLTSMFMLTAD